MPKFFSGRQVIKILCREFGFYFVSQKGSHVKLKKQAEQGEIITIVPVHKELSPGTLNGVLELAKIGEKEFLKKRKK